MNALQQTRSKVNGKFLQHHSNKNVSLLAEVVKVNAAASTIEVRTTDDFVVTVIMNDSFNENLKGWIEVRGVAQGKNAMIGRHIISFPQVMFHDFDKQLYDDVVTVINTFNNPWVNAE